MRRPAPTPVLSGKSWRTILVARALLTFTLPLSRSLKKSLWGRVVNWRVGRTYMSDIYATGLFRHPPRAAYGAVEKVHRRSVLNFTPPLRGRASRGECPMKKPPFKKVEGTPLSTGKPTPPTPPYQGGKKKQKHLYPVEASPFYTPLTRGGRGGCLYPLGRRARGCSSGVFPSMRLFQQPLCPGIRR